jgi:hypothetical protein
LNALDFFVNFARTGNICGLGLDTTPQQWADALGDRCISAVNKKQKQMRRDYGLVELTFSGSEESWRFFSVSVQAHRLWWSPDSVPDRLRSEYGPFPKIINFEDVRSELRKFGLEPCLIDDMQISDHARYYISVTKILIYALSPDIATEPDHMRPGALWSMYLTVDAEVWAEPTRKTR